MLCLPAFPRSAVYNSLNARIELRLDFLIPSLQRLRLVSNIPRSYYISRVFVFGILCSAAVNNEILLTLTAINGALSHISSKTILMFPNERHKSSHTRWHNIEMTLNEFSLSFRGGETNDPGPADRCSHRRNPRLSRLHRHHRRHHLLHPQAPTGRRVSVD